MEPGFLQYLGVVLAAIRLARTVPADVAPSGAVAVLSLGLVLGLGLLCAVVMLVSFLVIRAIRKSHAYKKEA